MCGYYQQQIAPFRKVENYAKESMDNLFSCHILHSHDVGDKKDVISKLPDDILLHILSFLSTKDAVQTSILARRWKFLWTYLSEFNLRLSRIHRNETVNSLLNLVDKLPQKTKYIKRFCFESYGIPVDVDRANSWISALLKHKIEELCMSSYLTSSLMLANNLSAPESLNSLDLMLRSGIEFPSCIHFPGLKTLTLLYATFSDETSTQQLFSSFPVLQELTLSNCDWNIRNVSIKISTLTSLAIDDYDDYYIEGDELLVCKVMIDAMNLVSLSCINYREVEFVPINLTSLVAAFIDVSEHIGFTRVTRLLSGICHVKSLELSNDILRILSHAKNLFSRLPIFYNLTHIRVPPGIYEFTYTSLMDILEKSPNVKVLEMDAGFHPDACLNGEDWTLCRVPHCFKSNLKSFSISNFDGSVADMQLLSFLLKNATLLEKIKIFCLQRLSADLKKQAKIRNQLEKMPRGLVSCAIELQTPCYKMSRD